MLAALLLVVAILPMYAQKAVSKGIGKSKLCKLTFETRHAMHLLVAPMGVVLCWHHTNLLIFCLLTFGICACDRLYLSLFKTMRVEEVTFTRLGDKSVQMTWRNLPGRQPRAGEYVRVMVPAISKQFHPFSAFDYFPTHDTQYEGKRRISNYVAATHVTDSLAAFREARTVGNDLDQQEMVKNVWISTSHSIVQAARENTPPVVSSSDGEPTSEVERKLAKMEAAMAQLTSNLNNEPSYSQVHIGAYGDWTRSLSDHVAQWGEQSSAWVGPCWIQGPFTSPFNASIGYGNLILVVTGIGITAALPIVQQLHHSGRKVFLVWITASKEMLSFQLPMVLNCTSSLIFFDRDGEEDYVKTVQHSTRDFPHLHIYQGRPNLEKVVDWIVVSQYPAHAKALSSKEGPDATLTHTERTPRTLSNLLNESFTRGWNPAVVKLGGSGSPTRDLNGLQGDGLHMSLPVDAQAFEKAEDAFQLLAQLPSEDRSSWAILYCGGVPFVQKTLKTISKRYRFVFSEESFSW